MKNNIEYYLTSIGKTKVYVIHDKYDRSPIDVYVYCTNDVLLFISKEMNNVVNSIPISQISNISIDANTIHLNTANEIISVYDRDAYYKKLPSNKDEVLPVVQPQQPGHMMVYDRSKYPSIAKCEGCLRRKCVQYDLLKGSMYRFGSGHVAEELLQSYEYYCKQKIETYKCGGTQTGQVFQFNVNGYKAM